MLMEATFGMCMCCEVPRNQYQIRTLCNIHDISNNQVKVIEKPGYGLVVQRGGAQISPSRP
jgi:hypothetical protein